MCTETGIKDVYRGVQGACPRRAVTHAGGTAERRAVGMGLKLVDTLLDVELSIHQGRCIPISLTVLLCRVSHNCVCNCVFCFGTTHE